MLSRYQRQGSARQLDRKKKHQKKTHCSLGIRGKVEEGGSARQMCRKYKKIKINEKKNTLLSRYQRQGGRGR